MGLRKTSDFRGVTHTRVSFSLFSQTPTLMLGRGRMEYHEASQTLAICNLRNGVDLYSLVDDLVRTGTILMDIPLGRIYRFNMRFGKEGEIIIGGIFGKVNVYHIANKSLLHSLSHSASEYPSFRSIGEGHVNLYLEPDLVQAVAVRLPSASPCPPLF